MFNILPKLLKSSGILKEQYTFLKSGFLFWGEGGDVRNKCVDAHFKPGCESLSKRLNNVYHA